MHIRKQSKYNCTAPHVTDLPVWTTYRSSTPVAVSPPPPSPPLSVVPFSNSSRIDTTLAVSLSPPPTGVYLTRDRGLLLIN